MNISVQEDTFYGELHLAGQWTEPGSYREITSGRIVTLKEVDILPGSLDGRVACYVLIANTWAQIDSEVGQPGIKN